MVFCLDPTTYDWFFTPGIMQVGWLPSGVITRGNPVMQNPPELWLMFPWKNPPFLGVSGARLDETGEGSWLFCSSNWTSPERTTGWWCNVPILKNDGVRRWEGLFHPIYEMEVILKPCLKPPTRLARVARAKMSPVSHQVSWSYLQDVPRKRPKWAVRNRLPLNPLVNRSTPILRGLPWSTGLPVHPIFRHTHRIRSWKMGSYWVMICPIYINLFIRGVSPSGIPSGNLLHNYWKWPICSGFTHWKWWFSMVMLVYQRVYQLYTRYIPILTGWLVTR